MKFPHNLVCIDVETTDSNKYLGSIIQLSAIVVDQNFNVIPAREFNTYIKPLDDFRNPDAMAVNKISEEILRTAPTLQEALEMFESFCDEDDNLSAWGAYFDIPFLRKQYEKIYRKYPFSYRYFDLKSVAIWEMAKRDIQMTSGVTKFLNALNTSFVGIQHDALDDIKNSVEILRILKNNS